MLVQQRFIIPPEITIVKTQIPKGDRQHQHGFLFSVLFFNIQPSLRTQLVDALMIFLKEMRRVYFPAF